MNMLILTIIFPLIGFILLSSSRGCWSENTTAIISSISIGLTALSTIYIATIFLSNGKNYPSFPLWSWISICNLHINFNLILDELSLIMIFLTVGIGFLIHIFASWYMKGEEGYSRFFAYTNLFIANMAILVLADNLLLMYFGWEGVGFCSYLLINFYYHDPKNNTAAIKAFIITRISDVLLIFAIFIFYNELGTLNFKELAKLAPMYYIQENQGDLLWWATLMLLGGAVGKSAQVPMQTWLIDAMVSPTPISALIHAATMVTAGVYLITRTYDLFLIKSEILNLVGIVGSFTIVLASFSALVQSNIKRILAYSTMSQVGYMFLALGIKDCGTAILHLITHAFFKALLFLSSGSVIIACHYEQNIFKMGGLRKSIPLVYFCFLIGSSTLPLITSGFFSKDKIIASAVANGYISLAIAGFFGTFMTSLYIFRIIFTVFHGRKKIITNMKVGIAHHFPLIVLLIFSTFIGTLIILPLLNDVLELNIIFEHHKNNNITLAVEIASSIVTVLGILIAIQLWLVKKKYKLFNSITNNSIPIQLLRTWIYNAWGFDWVYNIIFVKLFLKVAWLLKYDPLNKFMDSLTLIFNTANKSLLYSENGYLRWYIISMSIGIVVMLILLIILT